MKKRYTVRYIKNGGSIISAVSNYAELQDLLKGDAKNSKVETKMTENMPPTLHNLIGSHNHKIKNEIGGNVTF